MRSSVWYDNEGGKAASQLSAGKSGSFQLYIINIHFQIIEEKELAINISGKIIKKQNGKRPISTEIIEEGVLRSHSYADREFPLDITIKSVKPNDDEQLKDIVFRFINTEETTKRKVKIIKIDRIEKRGVTAY